MNDEDEAESEMHGPIHMRHRHRGFMRRWMRHAAMVPKGFIRYHLLLKLSEKPMSGSEIMVELENETRGYWRPSPGSIYPLLAWLQDQNLIKEAAQTEPGIKRYMLTAQGNALLQTEIKSREEISKHLQNLGSMWWSPQSRHDVETGAARDFFHAVRNLHRELRKEHPKEAYDQANMALEEATRQIQSITKKLQT